MSDAATQNRRENDAVVNLLRDRIDDVSRRAEDANTAAADVGKTLSDHVKECAAMQKRVLLVGAAILIWLVAHSPEMAKAVSSLFKVFS